jgi:hypothetical protein
VQLGLDDEAAGVDRVTDRGPWTRRRTISASLRRSRRQSDRWLGWLSGWLSNSSVQPAVKTRQSAVSR